MPLHLVTTSPSLQVARAGFLFFSEISSSLSKRSIYSPDSAPEAKLHDMLILMPV